MDEIFQILLHSWIVTGLNINLSSSKWFLKSKNFKLGFPLGRDKQLIQKKLFLKHVFVIGINLYRLKRSLYSGSPGPLSIPLGPLQVFSKIRGDIRELMFISGVNDTGEKKNNAIKFFFFIFCWELSLEHFTLKDWIFAYF
jgi:hypothetical protein